MPAHQEEYLVGRSVDALMAAAARVPEVATAIVVVADGCTDRTAEVARSRGATVLEIEETSVGAARAAGFAWLLAGERRPEHLWLATTDADSRVPSDWLATQLAAAADTDAYLGTIALASHVHTRFAGWIARYHAAFESPERHGHVHGASMGMWAEAYRQVGGFRALPSGEDVDLVERLAAAGARITWDARSPVVTSSRLTARAPAGVARDLARSLADERESVR